MIAERTHLNNFKPYSNYYVTFGDGARGNIIGKGQLDYSSVPCLKDVLLIY